jgi:Fe(3+) dicitrate transport protein
MHSTTAPREPIPASPPWRPALTRGVLTSGALTLLLLLFGWTAAPALMAQSANSSDGRLEGRVLAEGSGAPLSGTTVELAELGLRTRTSEGGYFAFRRVPAGVATVSFDRLGYASEHREVEIREGARTSVEVVLESRPVGLDPLVVRSQRTRMIGDPLNLEAIPGSAHFLSLEDLEAQKVAHDNVHEFLRRIPGVNVQEEEGYGLRPNIGMRGTGVSRSSKITLMEDGVLIAPAPYAAPAAYHFPVVGRMEAIEVRKGSSQVRYGPRTIGGAINLVSASIPDRPSWTLDARGGEDRTARLHLRGGDSGRHFGWLVETYQLQSDGFKEIQGGGDTGFRVGDYVGRFRLHSDREAPRYQELELKLAYNDHTSDETYLGLTQADFRTSPFVRYAASRPDRIDTEHKQVQLRHFFQPSSRVDLTTTAYHIGFARNWYKLQSVLGTGISSVLDDPEAHLDEMAILRGGDSQPDAFMARANNREYFSRGVQSVLGFRLEGERVSHGVEVGARLHRDQEDRFQWEDGYRMVAGTPVLTSEGVPGTQDNRVGDARALSLYVQDEMRMGNLTLVPGLRYEHITLTRTDYPTDVPSRDEPTRIRELTVSSFIPGVGAALGLTPSLHLFGGIHRGFGPPGPGAAEETRPEKSVNYEMGARVRSSGLALQVAGFFSDYRNILGEATLATGDAGVGTLYNGGAVHAGGLEGSVDYDLGAAVDLPFRLPVGVTYTFTRATFRTSFDSDFSAWGQVERGDHLPYLPTHQGSGRIALEDAGWSVSLSASGAGAMRTRAGQGTMDELHSTDAFLVLSLQGQYQVPGRVGASVYGGIQNLGDRTYVVARRPAGARPGLPRTVFLGVRVSR